MSLKRMISIRALIFGVLSGISLFIYGQSSVGINTKQPNSNAVLHLVSPNSDQGLLIPALRSSQRLAMPLTVDDEGLIVYDVEEGQFFYWHNLNWESLNPINEDNDASNELQNLSFDGSNLNISSGTGLDVSGWDTNSSDDFDGAFGSLSGVPANLDTDATDDFDGDYGSLLNQPTIPTTTSQLTNDSGFVTSADDADADASNELQNLSFDGSNLNISSGTGLDVSGWDTNSSDDFDGAFGSLSGVPANLDTDATDDFDGDYESLSNQPTIPTTTSQLTNDSGFVTSADDADADASNELQNLSFDGSNLNISSGTGLDVSGWDTDSSDDFDGAFSSLSGVPVNLDIDATDDFDGDYGSLLNQPTIPTTTSQLTNDSGFVTSADDADADASNELQNLSFDGSNLNISSGTGLDVSGWDTDSSDDFDGDYESLSNKPTIPTTTSQLTNDSGFVTSADDADADASNELQNLSFDGSNLNISSGTGLDVSGWDTDSSDDFDGDYGSLMNKPTIPTTTSQLTNDSGFVTSVDDADADASNELQNLSFDGSNLNISSGTGLDVSGWDTDSSDDFDGDYGSLLNQPTIPTTTSQLTNDSGFVTSADDADADASNELQNLSFDGSNLNISSGTGLDVSGWDTDSSDDFDGDYGSLMNKPTIPTTTSQLTNDSGFVTSAADADADASNELQNLSFDGSNLNISSGTGLDVSGWDTNSSDDFDGAFGSLSGVPANLDTDATDDFDGDYESLSNQPTIPTTTSQLTNDSGFVTSADDADADASNELQNLSFDGSNLNISSGTGLDVSGWDTDSSDDFDGAFSSLSGVPVNLDIDATDDFDGDYGSLLNQPTIPTTTSQLTNDSGFVTSADDADADASNELQNLSFDGSNLNISSGTGLDVSGWDTDSSDDFDGDYESLSNKPTIPTTTSQLTNDSGFVTSADDADADASNELQNLSFDGSNLNISSGTGLDVSGWDTDSSDDFDGDYGSLMNKPTIPTTTSQLTNDSGFVTSVDDADADASNELQNLSFDGSNLNISSGTGLDVSGWDTDSSDDFDGDYGSLLNQPTIPTTTSQLTNDSGFVTSADDADADASNELQNLSFDGSNLNISSGTGLDVSGWDTDSSDDFDGDYGSLMNKPTIPTTTSQLTNDSGFVTSAADADADASNELQNLSFDGSNLNISSGTGLDVSGWDTNSSDDFDGAFGSLSGVPANLDTDATDDFDGDYGSLSNKPTIPTTTSQLTNDSGFVTSADDADADASNELQNLSFDGSNLNISSGTGLDVSGWDTNSSDDFDGVFGSLSGIPANLDIDATDDFNGDYESLINKPTLGDLAALDQVSNTEISDNAVSTAKVADGAITEAKLSNSVAGDGLTGGTGSALAVSLSASSGLQFNSGSLEVVVGPGTTTYEAGGAAEAIGTIVVDAHGRVVSASSKTVVLSDRRLKTDIDTLQNSMESLQKLTGYSYFLKEDSLKEDRQYGVMAQDIEEILPDLLVHRHDGYLGVDYQGLIPVLIEALKEQSLIIDELKTKVSEESAKSERYEDRISELEASVEQIVNALKSNP